MAYDSKRTDFSSREGAQVLADQLRGYWLAKGYDVETWIVDEVRDDMHYFSVRSNIVAGSPAKRVPESR